MRAPGMNVPIEYRPSVTTTAGSSASSWRRRNGAQAAISSGCGSRLSGGRHFTTLVMNTSSRCQPIEPSSWTSSPPARPTNGRPSRSSLKPGPSPTNTTSVSGSPSPGTAFVRPSCSRHRVQSRTSVAMASSAAWRSARVTRFVPRTPRPVPDRLRDPPLRRLRHRRRARSPGGSSRARPATSAISTALDAAPLRRLSDTTQNARPRLPSIDRSWRTRPTNTSSDPAAVSASGYSFAAGIVLDHHALDRREQRAGLGRRDRPRRLDVDRLGVADEHRDADGRARDPQVGQVQDLAALGDDLPLLLRVPVVEEHVDVRQGVERDRVRVDRWRPWVGPRRAP